MEGQRKLRAAYQPAFLVKEPVMYNRFVLIAAATMLSTASFAAEPTKAPEPAPAQPHPASAQVVLASAAEIQPAQAGQQPQTPTPPKRRVARVTTCRCGDQQAQPEQ